VGDAGDAQVGLQELLAQRHEAGRSRGFGLMHIQEALQGALGAAKAKGHQLYVLVDTAHAEYSNLKLDKWQIPFASLFQGTPEASLIEIAPLLIAVNGLEESQRRRLFEWAQTMGYSSPTVSWFETKADIEAMAAHLRLFHTVGLSEGQTMLMRWYDTRILPVWFACLTLPQAEAFAAGIFNWRYVDRAGSVAALPVGNQPTPFPAKPDFGQQLITLTDQQYGLLVDAADLDVLLGHLRRIIPDELKRVPQHKLTLFVSRYQQEAISAGLDDIDRQTQYVLLALYTSGKGLAHPKLKAFMTHPPKTLDAFSDGLQALPDEVWEAGQPLWQAESRTSADGAPQQEFVDA